MSIASNNVVAKIAAVVAGLALVFSTFAVPAQAATADELQAQINALLAQLQTLQGGSSASTGAAFTADMTIGASGAEVTRLQNWLISKGYAIPAGATGYFGAQTAAAVAAYQKAKGITPAAGYFGPMTRAAVNAEVGTGGSTGGNNGGSTGLEGGAGSISEAEFLSSLNNEDVGEDDADVEVAGLDIMADEGSDIELTAVTLDFDYADSGGDDELEDYADEVSLWLDGEEVGRWDADEFNEDNDFSRTVSLDKGAIIRADENGELVVAVSGLENIEDTGEYWNVAFEGVRFRDADGATISDTSTDDITDGNEDTTTDAGERRFRFTSFADSADVELKTSLTDGDDADEINDAHVIDIDDSDDTDDVEVLAFTMEVKGDSDVNVTEIPVAFTSVEATGNDPDDLVSAATLWLDGDEIASENFVSSDSNDSAETITFEDLDLDLEAGEEYDFVVSVDALSTGGDLDSGDTLQAQVTVASIEAEDEAGEDLASGDLTGSAVGATNGLYEKGIMVEFVSADAEVTYTGDIANTNDHDRGTFEIVFDVTAFDSDVYVDGSAITVEDGNSLAEQDVAVTGSPTISGTVSSAADDAANSTFKVKEDETERFTVTVSVTPAADGFYKVNLDGVLYAFTAVDGTDEYTFDMSEYETPEIYLNYDA